MLNPKKRIELENKHMSAFFFMFSLVFFGFFVWNRLTMNIIMFFFCFIWSMSFKNWQIMRETESKIDEMIKRKLGWVKC